MERANSRCSIRFHLTRLFGLRPYALWRNGSGHRHLVQLNQLNQPDQLEGFGQEMELFGIVEAGFDFVITHPPHQCESLNRISHIMEQRISELDGGSEPVR